MGGKKALSPRLRFPEFRDTLDWGQAALGTLLNRPPEYGVNAAAVPFSEDLPAYIRITDIDDDGRFVPAPHVSVDIKATEDQFLQPGDIVLARTGASVGKSYRYRVEDGRLVFAGFLIRVRPNLDRLVPEFLSAYLSTQSYRDWVRLTSARSGQPGINESEYASMPLVLPADPAGLPEQRKIADCLGSLDELIEAQSRKLYALKDYKKGLMQQLFPHEGETVPRLRFPEFRDAGEWNMGRLGHKDISTFVREKMSLSELAMETFVSTENLLPDYGGIATVSGLPSSGSFKKYRKADILISNIRPYLKKVWVSDRTGGSSNDVVVIRATSKLMSSFLALHLKNDDFIAYIMRGAKGVKMPRGDISLMKEYPLAFPAKKEQQEIAACLSSLDELISAQSRRLGALRTHKKGLMQQLFPATDESR